MVVGDLVFAPGPDEIYPEGFGTAITVAGPSAGLEWLYFKAPWGQQLELVSYPGGIAAYRDLRLDIWRPR